MANRIYKGLSEIRKRRRLSSGLLLGYLPVAVMGTVVTRALGLDDSKAVLFAVAPHMLAFCDFRPPRRSRTLSRLQSRFHTRRFRGCTVVYR